MSVLVASGSPGVPGLSAVPWREQLHAPLARARWLAHRLARWEAWAAEAIATDASAHAMPDLFLDTLQDEPARPPTRRPDLWVALEAETMIGPRAATR
jgi:hypothetical protein